MKLSPKQMAVLDVLRRSTQALSLPELLTILGEDHPARTVRRWLTEMVQAGLVKRAGKGKATTYSATTKSTVSFTEQENTALAYIKQPLFKRKPVSYQAQWLQDYKPNTTMYLSNALKTRLHQAGQRRDAEEPAGTYARHIYNRLLIDLSYHSSRLEGNTYSLLETKRLLLEGKGAEGKLNEEKIMLLNHKEAIRHLVDNASKLIINKDEICTLHFLLADGLVQPQYAGSVRDHGVRISGSTYIPYENQQQLDRQLVLIGQKARQILDPYEQSFFLLVHISYLQAFIDVNKRTARLSANIALILNNLVPLSFNDVEKDDYINAMLVVYECNDIGPLLELYVHSYLRTCELYNATVEALGFDEIRVRYRQQRREIMRHIIENQLVGGAAQVYINEQAGLKIPAADRDEFLQDVQEDLDMIDSHRIAGLGITVAQLNAWLQKYR